MSDSVWPHRRQPTRLPRPWDSSGKNTGVGCHFLLQCMRVKSESEVAQSCPILSDPMDCSLPGSSIHGIFQARVLEWGAIAFSKDLYKWMKKTNKPLIHTYCLRGILCVFSLCKSASSSVLLLKSTTVKQYRTEENCAFFQRRQKWLLSQLEAVFVACVSMYVVQFLTFLYR